MTGRSQKLRVQVVADDDDGRKMGGSQLKQLQATLKGQGLTGTSDGKNKRKRTTSGSAANGGISRAEKLAAVHSSFNTFDVKVNKRKFAVDSVNKGKPSQSKQAAIEEVSSADGLAIFYGWELMQVWNL